MNTYILPRLPIYVMAVIITVFASQFSYSRADETLLFAAEDIAGWKSSIAAGQAELSDDGFAIVSAAGGWGGGVSSPWLTVDFGKSLVFVIKVNEVSSSWALKMGFGQKDDQWGPYIQGDTANVGEFSYKLPGDLFNFPAGVQPADAEGVVDIQIRIWGVGAEDAQVWVESAEMFYENDPNDRPRFVDPELENAYAGGNSPVEPRGKLSISWGAIKQ